MTRDVITRLLDASKFIMLHNHQVIRIGDNAAECCVCLFNDGVGMLNASLRDELQARALRESKSIVITSRDDGGFKCARSRAKRAKLYYGDRYIARTQALSYLNSARACACFN